MIKAHQVKPYDDASKEIEKAADILDRINIAGLNSDDAAWLSQTIAELRGMRSMFYNEAHRRFCAERAGDVKPGE